MASKARTKCETKRPRSSEAKAAPTGQGASKGTKAPDARESARLAAWKVPPSDANDDGEIFSDEDAMDTGGVPSPHWCGEASGYNEAVGELLPLVTRFARLAQSERDQSCLVAARTIHALATYLGLPRERRNEKSRRPFLNKAAAILGSQAGIPEDRFPRLLTIHKNAEEAIASVVERALADGRDASGIALAVEIVREPLAPLGVKRILPYVRLDADEGIKADDNSESAERRRSIARIKQSTGAIEKLQQNADGGELRDAKEIVRELAHAAGYRGGKLFDADRKRNKRS